MIILILTEPEETGCTFTLEPWENTSGTPAGSYSLTEVSPSKYESPNITGLTGEWVILMKNGANEPVFSGFVLFSSAAKGKATEDPSSRLARIESKTSLLGSASVSVLAMVTPEGEISGPIVIGDDYLEVNGRSFEWTVPAVPGMVVGDVDFYFGGKPVYGGSGWLVQGEVSDAGGGNWLLSADLPRTATNNLSEGQYRWSGEIRDAAGNEVTRIKNESSRYVELVAKQT